MMQTATIRWCKTLMTMSARGDWRVGQGRTQRGGGAGGSWPPPMASEKKCFF